MKRCGVLILVLSALLSTQAAAQTMYRCKDAQGGTIYSQMPCEGEGRDQQEIEVKAIKSAERTAAETAAMEAMHQNRLMSSIADQEAACIRGRVDSIWRPTNSRIRQHEQQIAKLEADTRRARNNLAGATWEAGLREQIAGFHQMIAMERQTASSQEIEARRVCAAQRQAEEEKATSRQPSP